MRKRSRRSGGGARGHSARTERRFARDFEAASYFAAAGGKLTIESTPGHGTTVTAEVPIPQREDGPAEVDALT